MGSVPSFVKALLDSFAEMGGMNGGLLFPEETGGNH